MAWTGVITNKGAALLDQWALGGTLTITGAATGTGTVAVAALTAQTALVSQKQTASIVATEMQSTGLKVKLQITAPQTGYTLQQYGVWAKLGSGTAVLLALFQRPEGVVIPSAAETPDFVYTLYALLTVSNTGELEVTVDPSALVTYSTMEAYTEDYAPTYTEATALANLSSGEKLTAALGKLAKAVRSLIAHLADSVVHITAAERTAWDGKITQAEILSETSQFNLNPIVFPVYEDNIVVNSASSNQRKANLHWNYFESFGRSLSGSTFRSIALTSGRGDILPTSQSSFTLYKSDFKPVQIADATSRKLIMTVRRFRDVEGDNANAPRIFVATYDADGKIWWGQLATTALKYYRGRYTVDPQVFANGNICVFIEFRRPTHTLQATFDLDVVAADAPVETPSNYFTVMTDSGFVVQDNPSATTAMSASPMALGGAQLGSLDSVGDAASPDVQDDLDTM